METPCDHLFGTYDIERGDIILLDHRWLESLPKHHGRQQLTDADYDEVFAFCPRCGKALTHEDRNIG